MAKEVTVTAPNTLNETQAPAPATPPEHESDRWNPGISPPTDIATSAAQLTSAND
jgi:hypothetical protein